MKSFIADLAVSLVSQMAQKGLQIITKSNKNAYEKELSAVIQNALADYESKYPIQETDKIPFYDSQTAIDELLKMRFSPLNNEPFHLSEALNKDSRIITPTGEEIEIFLKIFDEHVAKNEIIRALNIEHNFKEEVFTVSESVLKVSDKIDDVSNRIFDIEKVLLNMDQALQGKDLEMEWSSQLEEIKSNVYNFMPKTALERIKTLEHRVFAKKLNIPALNASLSYVKAICLMDINEDGVDNEIAELFINAYTSFPSNSEYKMYASHSYLTLKNYETAKQLVEELLESDPYHIGAWAIKCYIHADTIREFIRNEVPKEVLKSRQFKVQVAYWLLHSKIILKISEIESLGLGLEILDPEEPSQITFKNKSFWAIYVQYMLHKLTEENQIYSPYGYPAAWNKNPLLIYCNDLAFKIVKALRNTELEETFTPLILLYSYTNFLLYGNKSDVDEMEQLYGKLTKKTYADVFRMVQVYNTLNTLPSREKAVRIVNDFGEQKHEVLCLCNSDNYYILNDYEKSKASFNNYLKHKDVITEIEAFNIMNRYLTIYTNPSEALTDLDNYLHSKRFDSEIVKDLMQAFILSLYSQDKEIAYEKLIRLDMPHIPKDLKKFTGIAFLQLDKASEAVTYFETYVDVTIPSDDLKLYCNALFKSGADTVKLISILITWREHFTPDFNLLNMELELWRLQAEWEKAKDVAEQGINIYPGDEVFLTSIFYTSQKTLDIATIKHFSAKAVAFPFENELSAISVANALLWARLAEDSLQLLYNVAIHKKNLTARQQYISILGYYPNGLFKEFDVAHVDTFVKFKIENKIEIFEITEENSGSFPACVLMHKKVNSSFTVHNPLSNKPSTGTILRITDKYLALLEEILEEAKNPMSGIRMEVIDLSENASIDEINTKLIEHYGVQGSLETKRIEDTLHGYYNNQIPFTSIAQLIFHGNQFDTYEYLTSKQSKFFKALPPVFAKNLTFYSVETFVLDATSVCFFWQLSEKLKIKYPNKFVISTLLKDALHMALEEEKASPASSMSVRITQEGITPQFYPDTFKEDRIKKYESILSWVEQNCIVESVPERINLLLKEKERLYPHGIANLIIDNLLLSERPKHVLLTNDLVYFSYFPGKTATVISPELYLRNFVTITSIEYSRFAIAQKHVGISIDRSVFIEELTKMLTNEEHNFTICLMNLRFDWNPNKHNIFDVVYILKWLYLEPWIAVTLKNTIAQMILLHFLTGMKPQHIHQIETMLANQFLLIPDKLEEVMKTFNDILIIKGFK